MCKCKRKYNSFTFTFIHFVFCFASQIAAGTRPGVLEAPEVLATSDTSVTLRVGLAGADLRPSLLSRSREPTTCAEPLLRGAPKARAVRSEVTHCHRNAKASHPPLCQAKVATGGEMN